GAGRFLEVAARSEAQVVGMDISSAIDAAKENLKGRRNAHFVQASIYEPPFRDAAFDGLYCIGVIQHTPDPPGALRALPRLLKRAGRIAVTIYERKRWTPLYGKYLIRPLTRRMKDTTLLRAIKTVMPVLFPITEVAFRLPVAGKLFTFAIPVANYVHERELSARERYRWAVLDTFDMLSPRYDQPQTQQEVEQALTDAGINNIKRLDNPGVNVVGEKDATEG
ncbi:MAG: class I SAM-dependent methyltransferase, partial [Acidobacteria bacterium]|nr:class I SAM-dependent methyltransferase [Acidobacteriota bacterium]